MFAFDTGTIVPPVCPDIVKHIHTQLDSFTLQIAIGNFIKVLGNGICLHLGLLEFSHQILTADVVDEMILSTDNYKCL